MKSSYFSSFRALGAVAVCGALALTATIFFSPPVLHLTGASLLADALFAVAALAIVGILIAPRRAVPILGAAFAFAFALLVGPHLGAHHGLLMAGSVLLAGAAGITAPAGGAFSAATAQSILQGLIAQLETDGLTAALVPLNTLLVNIQKNPDIANVMAQWGLFIVAIPAALPNLEAAAIPQIAAATQALLALIQPGA